MAGILSPLPSTSTASKSPRAWKCGSRIMSTTLDGTGRNGRRFKLLQDLYGIQRRRPGEMAASISPNG